METLNTHSGLRTERLKDVVDAVEGAGFVVIIFNRVQESNLED